MRNFWKRTNRGLILAGALLAGTAIYVGIDYARFSNGKDDMEQLLIDYSQAIAKASIFPESQWSCDYELTDADKKQYNDGFVDVVRTYWTDPKGINNDSMYSSYYYFVKSDMLRYCSNMAENWEMPGKITDYTSTISKLDIQKNGPGAAKFSMTVNLSVDATGAYYLPLLIYYDYIDFTSGDDYYEPEYGEFWGEDIMMEDVFIKGEEKETEEETFYKGNLRTTGSYTVNGELIYVDGAWKINGLDYNLSNSLTTTPVKGGN